MKVNAERIARLRKERSWSQDELATASGLNLRTIQRIEKDGAASLQSRKALAAALDVDTRDLDLEEGSMKCSVCGSNEIYEYEKYFQWPGVTGGETLLPGLGSFFALAKVCPSVCLGCGNVRIVASEEAREKLKASKHWRLAAS